ncbi:MAG TPA: phosphoribosylformylglycinamidine cyclo-ligase [Candidatus Saccharimonadales bacterium]|nr:phosphoribosylformylglycinamidine cyclo-ligase [Candidatus Saccharimonadales bacterium]
MTDAKKPPTYADSGVKTSHDAGLDALLRHVIPTAELRRGRTGASALSIGYFANVVDIGNGRGLALTTDGVGTKVLVAEMTGRYDTLGIDCVAMNVNDVICVGAEPVVMLDYLAVEESRPEILGALGAGLAEGARQAGVAIVGGELSQMKEVIKGHRPGSGVDLVGMCAGLVPLAEVNVGRAVRPGDAVIGLASSGIHSNGLSLARKVLFDRAGLDPLAPHPDLGRSPGEELLEPTIIYVKVAARLRDSGVPMHALAHITGDGLLNLKRIEPAVSFRIHTLPEPPAVFRLIQKLGGIPDTEMFRVFNMGIGFCVVVPGEAETVERAIGVCAAEGIRAWRIGEITDDPGRKILVEPKGLVGQGESFRPA